MTKTIYSEYDWKITAFKFGKIFVLGGVGAIISHFSGLPPTPTIIAVIAILQAAHNYMKHRN